MPPEIWIGAGAAAAFLIGSYALLFARGRVKQRRLADFLRSRRAELEAAGAKFHNDEVFVYEGRVHRLTGNPNPLLGAGVSLRLSLFTPHVYEFTLKRARHVAPASERLASDELYRAFAVEGMVDPALEDYLLTPKVRDAVTELVGERWDAVSRRFVESILWQNRFDHRAYPMPAMKRDLALLRSMDEVPLERRHSAGTMTIRHGVEVNPWPWHWKPEELLLLPPKTWRFCVSYWDGPALNAVVMDMMLALAQGDRVFIVTDEEQLPEVACAFGGGFTLSGHLFEFDTVRVAIAADLATPGRFCRGIIACPAEFADSVRRAYAPADRSDFHILSVGLLSKLTYYARPLRDDEDCWYSGEYEILTTKRTRDDCERVARESAGRVGARVRTIERQFLPKLLKDDRLEMTA